VLVWLIIVEYKYLYIYSLLLVVIGIRPLSIS